MNSLKISFRWNWTSAVNCYTYHYFLHTGPCRTNPTSHFSSFSWRQIISLSAHSLLSTSPLLSVINIDHIFCIQCCYLPISSMINDKRPSFPPVSLRTFDSVSRGSHRQVFSGRLEPAQDGSYFSGSTVYLFFTPNLSQCLSLLGF